MVRRCTGTLLKLLISFVYLFSLSFDDEVMELCKMGQSVRENASGMFCLLFIVYRLLCGIYMGYITARESGVRWGYTIQVEVRISFLEKYDRVLNNTGHAFYDNTNSSCVRHAFLLCTEPNEVQNMPTNMGIKIPP